jgi:hypothetical protein
MANGNQGSADLFFKSAAFPGFFSPQAAELNANSALPDYRTTALAPLGERVSREAGRVRGLNSPRAEAQIPNPESRTPAAVLRMQLVGANSQAKVSGLEELPGKSNYFIGNDPKKWRTHVPNYAKVKYANVYPGVDLVYYGNQGQLEYDFVVQPGADPRSIQLAIVSDEQVGSRQKAVGRTAQPQDSERESQSSIVNRKSAIATPPRIDRNGDLVVGTDGGEVIFHKPVVYQPATYNEPRTKNQEPRTTNKELVEGKYVVKG